MIGAGIAWAADGVPLLGALAVACAAALPLQRQPAAMLALTRTQSGAVALAAAWQGLATDAPGAWGIALAVLLGGVAVLPWALQRHAAAPIADRPPAIATVAVAALLGLALLAALPAHLTGLPASREGLALVLAAALLALLTLATRRTAVPQLAGAWALANAVALGGVVAGAALPAALAVAGLFGFIAAGTAMLPAPAEPP